MYGVPACQLFPARTSSAFGGQGGPHAHEHVLAAAR